MKVMRLNRGRAFGFVVLLMAVIFFFTICSKAAPMDIPDWYLNPNPTDDVLWATGSAKMPDLNMAMVTAEARARESLAYTLSTTVKNTEDGITISSNVEINGARVIRRVVGKDGTVYVLVALSKDDAKASISSIFDSEAAQYAEFKASQALDMLDALLAKQQSGE